jgi:hypothetical protein
MTPKGRRRPEGEDSVKTTVDLPRDIWRAAKIRALDEGKDLRAVIIEALAAYLKGKGGRRKDSDG